MGTRHLDLADHLTRRQLISAAGSIVIWAAASGRHAEADTGDAPLPEHLAPSVEAPAAPEIQRLASDLHGSPIEIIGWVQRTIAVEPGLGVFKGAEATLEDGIGTPADQAALAVALLRAAGVPARFVYGEIQLTREAAEKWLGVHVALDILVNAQSATPKATVTPDPLLGRTTLRHVWVEFHVSGQGWVPADPSFKRTVWPPLPDIPGPSSDEIEALMWSARSKASVSERDGSVTGVDTPALQAKLDSLAKELPRSVGDKLSAFVGPSSLEGQRVGTIEDLRAAFPHTQASIAGRAATMPDDWHLTVRVQWGDGDVDFRIRGAELGNKRVSLWWVPFSKDDADRVRRSGFWGREGAFVKLRRLVVVDGVVKAVGQVPVLAGMLSRFVLAFRYPSGHVTSSEFNGGSGAGSIVSLVFTWGQGVFGGLARLAVELEDLRSRAKSGPVNAEAAMGGLARLQGVTYWTLRSVLSRVTAEVADVSFTRLPSVCLTGFELAKDGQEIKPLGFFIDIRVSDGFVASGDQTDAAAFWLEEGVLGSILEGEIFSLLYQGRGVSTCHVIAQANRASTPIYIVTQANADEVFPRVPMPPGTSSAAVDAVRWGLVAIIPGRPVSTHTADVWGLWVLNPGTGMGSFWISDQLHGGFMAAAGPVAELVANGLSKALSIARTGFEIAGMETPLGLAVDLALWASVVPDVIRDVQSAKDPATRVTAALIDLGGAVVGKSLANIAVAGFRNAPSTVRTWGLAIVEFVDVSVQRVAAWVKGIFVRHHR